MSDSDIEAVRTLTNNGNHTYATFVWHATRRTCEIFGQHEPLFVFEKP